MARKISCGLLGSFLFIAFCTFVGSNSIGRAHEGQALLPGSPSNNADIQQTSLVLTWRDNGGVFTIPVNGLIFLQIPTYPYTRLRFDPNILRLLLVQPMPMPADPELSPTPGAPSQMIYPAQGWRLVASQPGSTLLTVVQEPCYGEPCPKMPLINFSVTIIVSGRIYPPPPPPATPIRPLRTDVYIGTAYLNQTVSVQRGQIVTLELPFLTAGRRVQVQYDPAILQPLPGQNLSAAQVGGWNFQVIGIGTTSLTVSGDACIDGNLDCKKTILFEVTLTTNPRGAG